MKTKYYLLVFLLICVVSCKKDIVVPAQSPPSQRTLLVFMGGDNNLYKETYDKLEALRKGYTSGMGRLIVFQSAKGITPRLVEIQTGTNGEGQIREIKTYKNYSTASTMLFKEVLNDIKVCARAESYGLILFSHGSGWMPQQSLLQPYALTMDKDDMNLRDFAAAIPDHFFDFMIFESCLMSGIEVMYELKDKTNFVVASSSEIVSPGFTPIYGRLLSYLYQPEAKLKDFAQLYFDYYNQQKGASRAATIAITDTRQLDSLVKWVSENALLKLSEDQLKTIQHFDRFVGYSLFFDFEDYYQHLSPAASHEKLALLLSKAVPFKAATPTFLKNYNGFNIAVFSGLTSYIPQDGFEYLNTSYKKLKWVSAISSNTNVQPVN